MQDWILDIQIDQVLRGQGADPDSIRTRSPQLIEIAKQALEEGVSFLRPQVYQQRMAVEAFSHDRIRTASGATFQGSLIANHLAAASEVVAVLCTIGSELERHASEVMAVDVVKGLALDGVGSAAVEALANAACSRIERQAKADGLETSIPLSPGMEGWPVDVGQAQIFALWGEQSIGIHLTDSYMMIPRKSLSMVIGVGKGLARAGTSCDYCRMRDTCRYQGHYT